MKKLVFSLIVLLIFNSVSYASFNKIDNLDDLVKIEEGIYMINSKLPNSFNNAYSRVGILFINEKEPEFKVWVYVYDYDCNRSMARDVENYTVGYFRNTDLGRWSRINLNTPVGKIFTIVCSK